MLGHKVLFIYGQIRFAQYDSIFDHADTGNRTHDPKQQNKKDEEKKFFDLADTGT